MRVQLDQLARQDQMAYQDHLEGQEELVLLDLQDGQVVQAIQVYLDHRAFRDIQVINHG